MTEDFAVALLQVNIISRINKLLTSSNDLGSFRTVAYLSLFIGISICETVWECL